MIIAKTLPAGSSQTTCDSHGSRASVLMMKPGDFATNFFITKDDAGLQLDVLEDVELRLVRRTSSVGHLALLLEARIRFGGSVFLRIA